VCAGAANLCVVGGDAARIVPVHFAPSTFHRVFVNHPEPPQQTARGESYTSEGKHLLTPDFLSEVARTLAPGGMLVIATDNLWYARLLLRQFASDPTPVTSRLLLSAELEQRKVKESDMGVSLFEGRPGRECGVSAEAASSYFDRLWNRVQVSDRYFLAFVKNRYAGASVRVLSSAPASAAASSSGLAHQDQAVGPTKSLKKIKREGVIVAAQGQKIRFADE
jgi:hypothetical protein